MFQAKLEQLLEYYRYKGVLPDSDQILTGVLIPVREMFDSLEIVELYEFVIGFLKDANNTVLQSQINPQKASYLKNTIECIAVLQDVNLEIFFFASQTLIKEYDYFGLEKEDMKRFGVLDTDAYKKIIDITRDFSF